MVHLFQNLWLGSAMVLVITLVHFAGLTLLTALVRHPSLHHDSGIIPVWRQGMAILAVVLGLFLAHTIEIWLCAILYMALGQFSSLEEALYFSTSTFTTVGFGDVVLVEWRMLAAIESAAGFLMIGWSTAFLVSLTSRLRILEAVFESHSGSKD
ncbi:MAG: K+ channel TrkA-N [Oceanospirillaceae bacterium]|nr:K+ channel TrkA-N [Oceanospirillaceae bacterium]|tara:strand:- start:1032 stop:1493 length:462 start_codon:yes stop_codon:yes gene_type:complete